MWNRINPREEGRGNTGPRPDGVSGGWSRRAMLESSALGFGALALEWLAGRGAARAADGPGALPSPGPGLAMRRPPARAVIMLVQNGGPSQMDLFDPKPELTRRNGRLHQGTVEQFQSGSEANRLLGSPFRFHHRGASGMELSEVIPCLGGVADELCLVRSMVSGHNNHTEALVMLNTGKIFPGRPALGSWVSYALGSECENLPAYIVLRDPEGYNTSGTLLWQSGWLPALHAGTEVATRGAPILHLQPPAGRSTGSELAGRGLLASLNERHRVRHPDNPELEARIHNLELAARMQLAAPGILDIAGESAATRRLYGLDHPVTAGYGLRCLMARRLVEAGVRFVQVFPPVKPQFQPWDSHSHVRDELEKICAQTDQPSAALILDLKERGLLDSTVVLWSGEFGRLPISQNGRGRDHNRNAFSLLLAGGGFRRGHVHGATDDLGYRSEVGRVTVPDLHATILDRLGMDHSRLIYRHEGIEETPTDVRVTQARVIRELVMA